MGITLEEIEINAALPINPTIIRIMRVLRIARGERDAGQSRAVCDHECNLVPWLTEQSCKVLSWPCPQPSRSLWGVLHHIPAGILGSRILWKLRLSGSLRGEALRGWDHVRSELSLLLILGTTIVVVWGAEATKQVEICTGKVVAKVWQDGITVKIEGRESDGRKNQNQKDN